MGACTYYITLMGWGGGGGGGVRFVILCYIWWGGGGFDFCYIGLTLLKFSIYFIF